MCFGDSKVSYSGAIIQSFQGLFHGNGVALKEWFIISFIIIIYIRYKIHGVENKNRNHCG